MSGLIVHENYIAEVEKFADKYSLFSTKLNSNEYISDDRMIPMNFFKKSHVGNYSERNREKHLKFLLNY